MNIDQTKQLMADKKTIDILREEKAEHGLLAAAFLALGLVLLIPVEVTVGKLA